MTRRGALLHAPIPGAPQTSEYPEPYAGYVSHVEGDVLQVLAQQIDDTVTLLREVPPDRADYAYAPGKWTVKEVVGHVNDVERVFCYRAMCFARGETQPQPGFDQDAYVTAGQFQHRPLEQLLDEFAAVRAATVALFHGFGRAEWMRGGIANDAEFTVRAVAYILAGHERHHLAVLRERYL